MKNDDALDLLIKQFPGTHREPANSFGDSPSSPGRMAIVIPLGCDMQAVNGFCQKHSILLGDPICGSAYGHHRLVIDPDHDWNVDLPSVRDFQAAQQAARRTRKP